jgi:EpsD family peptidyl-prolyl cis-trans isomerase
MLPARLPVVRDATVRFACAFLLLFLAACGKGESKPSAQATQAAARVDGTEISVHQINFAMSRLQGIDAAKAEQAGKDILERLIEQQLLVSKAVGAKLDRDPRVMQAIEESRRQILAQAYLEKAMVAAPTSSQDDIAKFYKERPELFAQRKQFRYVELSAAAKPEVVEELKKKLAAGTNINDAAAFLKSKSVEVNGSTFERTSEQLPMELLPRLHKVKQGQTALLQGGERISLIQMLETKDVPLTQEQAKPLIERFLVNQKRMQLAQSEVRQLRDAAKIEYLGNFKAPPAKAADAVSTPAVKTADEGAKPSFIDKGLSGIR